MKRFLCLYSVTLVLGLGAGPAQADSVAYSCDHKLASLLTPVTQRGACTGFKDKKGKVVDFGLATSGAMVSSSDGRSVAMVQTFVYADMDGQGTVTGYGAGGKKFTPPAVLIYRDGKRVATLSFARLLKRKKLVSLSTSHIQWLLDWQIAQPASARPTLKLHTTSFRRIEIDMTTGAIVSEKDDDTWKKCDVIAYGNVHGQGEVLTMNPAFVAKGPKWPAFMFTAQKALGLGQGKRTGYKLLCLKRTFVVLEAAQVLKTLMNGLTVK